METSLKDRNYKRQMKNVEKIIKKIYNQKLLVIFPHPDDESVMAGGLVSFAVKKGWPVKVVSLTEGSRGRVHIHGKGRSVAQMRRGEFIKAMEVLGVEDYEMWKEEDGKLIESELWRIRVRRLIESYDPGLVVSYDLSGVTGHPDHIELGREILRIKREKDFRLWWPTPTGKIKERFVNKKVERYLGKPDYSLWMKYKDSMVKWKAVYEHKSQGMDKEFMWPYWAVAYFEREERFVEAKNKKYKFKRVKFSI